jgi:hypothetical protein
MRKLKPGQKFVFDRIFLVELQVNRISDTGDSIETKFVYSSGETTYGAVELKGQQLISDASKKKLSELIISLEKDGLSLIAGDLEEDMDEENKGLNSPIGIADEVEEADQL